MNGTKTGAPAQGLSEALRLVSTLTVAGLLSGLAIVGVYQATLPTILANQAAALRRAVFKVLPGAERMESLVWRDGELVAGTGEDAAVYAGYGGEALVGYAIAGQGAGFQDTIRLLFGFDPRRQRVVGLEILDSRETPGLGDRIYKDPAFVGAFKNLAVEPAIELVQRGAEAANQVDAISGATISSRSVVNIVNGACSEWLPRLPTSDPPQQGAGEPDTSGPGASDLGDGTQDDERKPSDG